MNPLKVLRATALLGLLVIAAFAGTASATVLTSPAGTAFTGTKVSHSVGEVSVFGRCKTAGIHEEVESHGAAATAVGKVTGLTFSECTTSVTVLKTGSMEVHGLGNGNGTVTASGFEFTSTTPALHCVYTFLKDDHLGTLTGSKNTGGTAVLHVNAVLVRTSGNFFCGATTQWTGTYVVQTPDYLDVD